MTPDERAALRALAEAATPGPWECYDERAELENARPMWVLGRMDDRGDWMHDLADLGADPQDRANGEFIATARTAILRLLDALDAAEADLRIEKAGRAMDNAQHQEAYSLLHRSFTAAAEERNEARARALEEAAAIAEGPSPDVLHDVGTALDIALRIRRAIDGGAS